MTAQIGLAEWLLALLRMPISLIMPATIRAVYAPRENPNKTI